jgi:hypothetical protein
MSGGATRKRDPASAGALKARPLIERVSRTLVEVPLSGYPTGRLFLAQE